MIILYLYDINSINNYFDISILYHEEQGEKLMMRTTVNYFSLVKFPWGRSASKCGHIIIQPVNLKHSTHWTVLTLNSAYHFVYFQKNSCIIGGSCYGRGAPHPEDPCRVCQPDVCSDSWRPNTSTCPLLPAGNLK